MSIVYLNGDYMPLDQARVSVLDRGFLFGDGVYEVIPAYGGHLLRIDEHLDRLQNSLDAIHLVNPLSRAEWLDILHVLLDENEGEDQSVYLQLSRGVAPQRDHSYPADTRPTVFVMVNPLKAVDRDVLRQGVAAITLDDIRWRACNIKATALLANTMLRQQATEAGAAEAILIRDGFATEGAASNIFIVLDNVLLTPPTGPLLLPGITRDLVLELARQQGIACEERPVSEAELRAAREIWLTSSTKEILPVIRLDDQLLANGQAGPIWERMIDIYQSYKARLRAGQVQ
jgi:D-alanine transaminase